MKCNFNFKQKFSLQMKLKVYNYKKYIVIIFWVNNLLFGSIFANKI
jgi:hypothetical protein